MKNIINLVFILILAGSMAGCIDREDENEAVRTADWKTQLEDQLSLFGHRNWILVVDKAFPAQNAAGIVTVDTKEKLLDVLSFTLRAIEGSTHVKPIVYNDKELSFITKEQVSDIDDYRRSLGDVIGKYDPQVLLHDSVFVKIDEASELFKVLVLKTEEVIAYSSVFIQLDCKYWGAEQEESLREAMRQP